MVFLRNLDQFLTGRFWTWIIGLFGYLDIYTNQLLVQIYIPTTVCTIAFSPFFKTMVNTAQFVNQRKCDSKNNEKHTRRITSSIMDYELLVMGYEFSSMR